MILKFHNFRIEFDKDYGVDKRSGWTISKNGSIIIELEKHLIIALIKYVMRKR